MSGVTRRGAVIVLALGVVMAACANDGSEPIAGPVTTEAADATTTTTTTPTTTTTTTAAATTTEPAPTTTVPNEPREFPYWSTACTELVGDADATLAFDPALAEFTTLGGVPSLDLVLPDVVTSTGPYPSIAATSPIPGGVLVGVYPTDYWPTVDEILYSSSLVAVNDDGSVRWRRCFDDDFETRRFAVAPAALEPNVAWVFGTAWDEPLRIVGVDLATGADVDFPVPVAELAERGYGSSRFLVFGPKSGSGLVFDGERLVVVDTLDGSIIDVSVPPSWIASEGGSLYLVDTDPADAEVVIADRAPTPGESAALYVDGSWTEDPALQRELLPLQVTETFGEPFELRLLDGAGDLVWSVPDFHSVGREGFHWVVADDVVVAMRCPEWDADGSCGWVGDEPPREEMVGFDLDTGQELWTTAGSYALPVLAGNTAIVTDWNDDTIASSGYVLLDLLTGERIGPDGAPWPGGSFAEECCGGYVYVRTERNGGVVIATNEEHVRVWYPPELTQPTVTVDLMG